MKQMLPKPDNNEAMSIETFDEMTLGELSKILSLTIKYDKVNKLVVFLAMLSAYTDSSQINISLNAPSSRGKSFLAIEIAKLFPAEDKIERSGSSPTAFFYEQGVPIKEGDKVVGRLVSLERKILLFYEQPNPQLQEKLRALLSHDQRDLQYSFTNKDKGKNKADKVILRGFPATIFCSAGLRLDEQEATRAILLSPEETDQKILAGMLSQIQRIANADEYKIWIDTQPERVALMERIVAIRNQHVDEIIIPNPKQINERFIAMFPIPKPRHMRDISHLGELIKAIALLNVWQRRQNDGTILANDNDVDMAFKLWSEFSESQEYNLPPVVLLFYKEIIVPAYLAKYDRLNVLDQRAMRQNEIGLTSQELNSYHISATDKPMIGEQVRKQILPQLESVGLIAQEKPHEEAADRRTRHIFPKWFPDGNDPKIQNNIGKGGKDNTDSEEKAMQDILDLFGPG
jgi:hypothetical protein